MSAGRRPYVAGNWKMHKTASEAGPFVRALAGRLPEGVDVAVCPPFTALAAAVEAARGTALRVLAQNMHEEGHGAFTGEVSAAMLLDLGVQGVLVGHSERRQLFGEDDASVNRKLHAAHAAGLEAILAVGEREEEREGGRTEEVLRRQVERALEGLAAEQVAATTIAYEPIWAIGTGRTATPEIAQEAHAFIRGLVEAGFGVGERVRIQYGGSMKPENAGELFAQPDVDGGLVGGASLEVDSFAAILAAAPAYA